MEYSFKNNRIAELRKAQNLTQLELADKIHTSQANLSRWEKGLNEPSIIQCWKIADFFEVSIDFLCGKIEY
ncbi:MAG: helix-turn-helix transcriptional regulator [Clostridia bacterium]|nr:helix-turn-helix transcriptional regulator [Clostridia bacterium]